MTKRGAATIALILCSLPALTGCLAIQQKPDGSLGFSLLPPGSKPPTETVGGSTLTSSGGSATSPKKGASVSGPRPVGFEQTLGTWRVNVESVERPGSLPGGAKAPSGRQLLVVVATVKKMSAVDSIVINTDEFKLVDAHGAEIKPFPTSLRAFNGQDVRPAQLDMGRPISFVFAVPKGEGAYAFVVTPKEGWGSMSWTVR